MNVCLRDLYINKILIEKLKDNKKIMKAQLFLHSYEDLHYLKTDPPACSHEAVSCNFKSLRYEVAGKDS